MVMMNDDIMIMYNDYVIIITVKQNMSNVAITCYSNMMYTLIFITYPKSLTLPYSKYPVNPSCLQATVASVAPKKSSQTVCHLLFM